MKSIVLIFQVRSSVKGAPELRILDPEDIALLGIPVGGMDAVDSAI